MNNNNVNLELPVQNQPQAPLIVNQKTEPLDIVQLAEICFDQWKNINDLNDRLDINQTIILLDAIGIKKNEYELRNLIDFLKSSPEIKNFNTQDDDRFDLNDFKEIVGALRRDKSYIDEKFLAEAFSRMDVARDGVLTFEILKKFAKQSIPEITDEEVNDMINYFWTDQSVAQKDRYMTYENFYKLYHEG
jgi:Ca2+-binding EF-hand superfamily protein